MLLTQKVEEYESAVTFAQQMADVMEHHIDVLPITGPEFMARNRDRIAHFVANLKDQERGKVRAILVAGMLDLMRKSDDTAIRAEAYETLRKLGVIQ